MPSVCLLLLTVLLSAVPAAAFLINGEITVVGPVNYGTSTTGTDAYAFTLPQAPTTPSYTTGACFAFLADVANTGPATLNIHGIGVRNIVKPQAGAVTVALDDNDIEPGQRVQVCYDGTNFQCQNCDANAKPIVLSPAAAATLTDCLPGRRYDVPLAAVASDIQQRCTLEGDGIEPIITPSSILPTGLEVEPAGILGLKYTTPVCHATDITLTDQRNNCFTVGSDGVTVTLPPAGAAAISSYMLVIDDTGGGQLTICPAGADVMNSVNACKTMRGQDSVAYLDLLGNKWRLVMAQVQAEGSVATTGRLRLSVRDALFPASNFAVLDLSEPRPKLLFDDGTSECASFPFLMPSDYGGSPVVYLVFSAVSGTAGTAAFDMSLWADNPGATADVQTESYATGNTCTQAAHGTAGRRSSLTCPLTNADSVTALALVNLKVCRNVATDTMTGDLEILNEMVLTYAR